MSRNFGFSNIYLKVGFALISISVAMLVAAFVVPSVTKYLSGSVAGFCLVSGAVLYIIGRISQVRRSRAQA
ncbi:hypothetical protein ACFPN1_16155 [Lysobacter yangpyeongensis]|uniref:Integron gene cassette protein n=1 Tax=Lysobacter yangpyeongensis TaxID=346182 RepID=A0ABW0SRR0_9GAMM